MLRVVGLILKRVKFFLQHFGCCIMLYSFGHVPATLLRRGMRTSSICYFKAPSNMLQDIATEWPNVCNMLCTTMLRYVALKCCVHLASYFTISHNMTQQCCAGYVVLKYCVHLVSPVTTSHNASQQCWDIFALKYCVRLASSFTT